jgi:hypothetical protein
MHANLPIHALSDRRVQITSLSPLTLGVFFRGIGQCQPVIGMTRGARPLGLNSIQLNVDVLDIPSLCRVLCRQLVE